MRPGRLKPSIGLVMSERKPAPRSGWRWAATLLALGLVACSSKTPSRPADTPTNAPSGASPSTAASVTPATASPTPVELPGSGALAPAASLLRDGLFDQAAAAYMALALAAPDPAMRAEALTGVGVARFENGDANASIAALREAVKAAPAASSARERASYFLGLRLNEAKRYDEASAVLQPFAGGSGVTPLGPYLLAEYARALAGAGDRPGASTAWDRLLALPGLSATQKSQVYQQRIDAARDAADTADLIRWLDAAIALDGTAQDRYERAQLARETGDWNTFAAQLSAIVSSGNSSSQAVQAIGDLKDEGYTVDPGQEGFIYYRRSAYAEARRVLLTAVDAEGLSSAEHTFRLYYLAAAYEDGGQPAAAVRYYDEAAASGATSPYVHRAKYWAARVTEGLGDAAGASSRYRALAVDGPSGEFSDEAAFRAGYVLLAGGDAPSALTAWAGLRVPETARLDYWRGRAYEATGDPAAARSAYQSAVAAGPLDFHGQEAAIKLGTAKPLDVSYRPRNLSARVDWTAITAWLATKVPGTLPGQPPTAAGELAGLGLREQAADLLDAAAKGAAPWRLLELAREAYDAGLLDVASQLGSRMRTAARVSSDQAPPDLLRVIYPIGYVTQLNSQAKSAGLDPLFLAALIRQESFWDPQALSSADAYGLTQVIPETGAGIARALGVEFAVTDLFRPAISIQFGAYYLGGELKRFGNPLIALAAYNAGPGNASRWQNAWASRSAADLVETIDIDQTQRYVELIVEHYAHYVRAWGN